MKIGIVATARGPAITGPSLVLASGAYAITGTSATLTKGQATEFSMIGSADDMSNLTTYNLTSVNIGTADADRLTIMSIAWQGTTGSRTLSSATINGVTATIHGQQSGDLQGCAIVSAAVPTGTSVNVDVVMSDTCARLVTQVYRAVPFTTTTLDVVQGGDATAVSNRVLSDLSIAQNGFYVAVATGLSNNGMNGSSNGTDSLQYDRTTTSAETNGRYFFGSAATTETNTTRDLTFSWLSGTAELLAVAVSWAPAGLTVVASVGGYDVTGTAASFVMSRLVSADGASYTITGTAATLTHAAGASIAAGDGSYSTTGQDASTEYGRTVVGGSAAYTITGSNATLSVAAISIRLLEDGTSYRLLEDGSSRRTLE